MIKEYKNIKDQSYLERLKFWPIEITQKKNIFIGSKFLSDDFPNNFWNLSEQYYTLAWTIFSGGYDERKKWSYANCIETKEDVIHNKLLETKISNNTWSPQTYLSLAHLSCELAFKAIIFHQNKMDEKRSYPKGHNLEILLGIFNKYTKISFQNQYYNWIHKENLEDIIFESDKKFINQRYGFFEETNEELGTLNLCRFIHEQFILKNIPHKKINDH